MNREAQSLVDAFEDEDFLAEANDCAERLRRTLAPWYAEHRLAFVVGLATTAASVLRIGVEDQRLTPGQLAVLLNQIDRVARHGNTSDH